MYNLFSAAFSFIDNERWSETWKSLEKFSVEPTGPQYYAVDHCAPHLW